MLRCTRLTLGAIGILCGCACSNAPPSSPSNDPSVSGGTKATGEDEAPTSGTASGGTPATDGGKANAGGVSTTDDPNVAMGGNDEPSAAGAAGTGVVTPGTRSIFYLDVQGRVLGFDEDEPTPRTLVRSAGQGPDGIAVDVAGGQIFWTTMGVPADDDGSVRRSKLDGSDVSTVVPAGGAYTPKQLKLDSTTGYLYWSDREGMRLQRAKADGSSLETLVTVASGSAARKDAANWCVGLALDTANGFIYWTQKGPDNGMQGSIRRAHLELPAGETDTTRTDIEVLFEGLPEPVDLDLNVSNGYMYWSDRGDDTISRAPIEVPSSATPATREDRQIIVRSVREAIGVALDVDRGHVYFTGAVNGRVGRANLDGSAAVDLVTGTGALTGIAVVQLASH